MNVARQQGSIAVLLRWCTKERVEQTPGPTLLALKAIDLLTTTSPANRAYLWAAGGLVPLIDVLAVTLELGFQEYVPRLLHVAVAEQAEQQHRADPSSSPARPNNSTMHHSASTCADDERMPPEVYGALLKVCLSVLSYLSNLRAT